MPLPDFDADLLLIDGLEEVTFKSVDARGNATSHAGVVGLRRAIRGNPLQGAAQVVPNRVTWHLLAASFPAGVTPKRGDLIVSAEGTWKLLSDDAEGWSSRYRCETQKVV